MITFNTWNFPKLIIPNFQISNFIFPHWKIFSDLSFWYYFSNLKNFLDIKFLIQSFRFRKFFRTPDFLNLQLFQFEKFSSILNCTVFPTWKIFSDIRCLFNIIFPTWKIFFDTKLLIQFFQINKFSPTPNFLFYFSNLVNLFWHQIFNTIFPESWLFILTILSTWGGGILWHRICNTIFENFSQRQISNTIIFRNRQIFSDTRFLLLFFCVEKFFLTPDFLPLQFSELENFFRYQIFMLFFRLGKFFLAPSFYFSFFKLANFLWHQISRTIFQTWKIFFVTKSFILFFGKPDFYNVSITSLSLQHTFLGCFFFLYQ